ncbi:UbiA family prenyltransferase [Arcticibacter sp.]|uniref:UbiA family prenyltransferase n=1 Tax=Arcticibacter sp. TaxID=1872630 RepID=UPI00388E7A9C
MAELPIRSTLTHLRLPFSLLLLPVYLFALGEAPNPNTFHALVVFIVLHLFVYPASNGFNSFFDKDEGSIGFLKYPPKVSSHLFYTSIVLEWTAVLLSLLVSIEFAVCVIIYNSFSKAYSHPSVRIKKYPLLSFLIVFLFQGLFIYYSCYRALAPEDTPTTATVWIAGLVCSCLVGASYPLTQIYQYDEDARRGDRTLSMMLGIRGSFVFSGILFLLGSALLYYYWFSCQLPEYFSIYLICLTPAIVYFLYWFYTCTKNPAKASFGRATAMTLISGLFMLVYFSWLLLLH